MRGQKGWNRVIAAACVFMLAVLPLFAGAASAPSPLTGQEEETRTPACTIKCPDVAGKLKSVRHLWAPATAKLPQRCLRCGKTVPGWEEVDGKYYYFYPDGSRAVNRIVDGRYVGTDGVRVDNDATVDLAVQFVLEHGGDGDREEQLHNCFEYLALNFPYSTVHMRVPDAGTLADVANGMFTEETGNCYCYAAAFAYIARVLGYESRVQCGRIRAWGESRFIPHGWTEVKVDGEWLLCDAQQSYHRDEDDRYMETEESFSTPLQHENGYTIKARNGVVYFE